MAALPASPLNDDRIPTARDEAPGMPGTRLSLSRRRFLARMATAAIGAVPLVLFSRCREQPTPGAGTVGGAGTSGGVGTGRPNSVAAGWGVNPRTHTLHFAPVCRGHWPRGAEPVTVGENPNAGGGAYKLHRGSEAAILEAFALQALDRQDEAAAMRHLEEAIQRHPLGLRPYDRIAALHRRSKRYPPIEALYRQGLAAAEAAGGSKGGKARAAFALRLETFANRAARAPLNHQEAQERIARRQRALEAR